jgi:hypothetical protein
MKLVFQNIFVTIQLKICRKTFFKDILGPFKAKSLKNSLNFMIPDFRNSLYYKELAIAETYIQWIIARVRPLPGRGTLKYV